MNAPLLSLTDGASVLIPPETPTSPKPMAGVRACQGCHRWPHGSVGVGIACLERHLGEARERIACLEKALVAARGVR